MNINEDFQIGIIVKLKSGGPDMTVRQVYGDNDVDCQWFAGKKLEKGRFPMSSLELVKNDKK